MKTAWKIEIGIILLAGIAALMMACTEQTYITEGETGCHLYPIISQVEGCMYQVDLMGCSEATAYRWRWQDWQWQYMESGSFVFTFPGSGVYDLMAVAYDPSGVELGSFNEGLQIDCGGSTAGDLNIRIAHKPGGGCDDVVISWANVGADTYYLYVDGYLEGVIPGGELPRYDYGYEQLLPVQSYEVIAGDLSDGDTFNRDCPGD